ncbi:MAG: DUF4238 domain-containing protein, partial [Bacteroidales bacterium]|nr:DUF4238 domain-containing protein [Bacteroidales bacterium]
TKSAVRATNEMIDTTLRTIFKHDEKYKNNLDEVNFEITEPAAFNLVNIEPAIKVTLDLCCKLIINKSNIPFITSNHPVVRYNQFLEKRKFPGGKSGLASKGLQIFYPISPWLTVIFYDCKVYKCGYKRRAIIETTNKTDIDSLNLLQALNCDDIIYFSEKTNLHYISILAEKREMNFTLNKGTMNEYPVVDTPDGNKSTLMHYHVQDHGINLSLSFIKETDYAKYYTMTGYAVELRNEALRGT